ncbi:MAG TPA: carboxypeptidase-like regulatory domain-containing protein [Vicinamibacterales bacterium]|nr:carboxypeptidase-like regulatory domain-containing protein [Vicinamibacterales bacterium]
MSARFVVVTLLWIAGVTPALIPAVADAQTSEATISGVVTDATEGALPGVTVTAIHGQTGQRHSATTNGEGFYALRPLPIGPYVIEAELSGFQRYRREGLTLTTGATVPLDMKLSLGELTDTVTVRGEAPLLGARTSEISQLIESRSVEGMPLGDRRSMNLIKMTGAAVFVSYDSGTKPNFSLAGGRTQSQMFWIDGGAGQNMRLGIGQVDVDPPVDTVQEVKILSNNYAAEYGGSAGGVIIATTKSGTNQLRGSLFEYFRNDALDATDFFAPVVDGRKQKAPLRYNVFGGTLGGPIRRDKTFFFVSYEGSRRKTGVTRFLNVPTEAQRRGDFSQTFDARGSQIVIYDPATTPGPARTPFPGNVIPQNRLDPVGLRIAALYPLPNRPGDNISGANNFGANGTSTLERDNYMVKVEHTIRGNDKITGRYMYNSDNSLQTSVFPEPAADTVSAFLRHQNYFYVGYTRTFGSALVNEVRYTYGNRINHERSPGLDGGWPTKLGLRGVSDEAFPRFTVAGVAALGATTHERRQFPIQQHQLVDTLSYVRGRHSLKTGLEVRPSINYEVNRPSISGAFAFGTQPTALPGRANTGYGLASLLLGFPNSVTIRETEVLDRSSWYLAAFVQDDWTVGSNLTLNFGVRWETDTPIVDANNRMNGFDPLAINPVSGTPGVVRFAGVDGWPSAPYKTDLNNFAPRFGFAWRPFGGTRTVIRGGGGIFYAHPFDHGAPSSASLGFERSATLATPDNGLTAPFFLKDGVPSLNAGTGVRDAGFGAVALGRPTTTAVTFFDRNRKTGYARQFNIGLQQELAGRVVAEMAYVGNLSRNLAGPNLSINQIAPDRLRPGVTQQDRPFPQFSNVSLVLPAIGRSDYHAGTARLEKRFSRGFSFLTTYTYSRFLNDTDEGGGDVGDVGVYSDFYNRAADYGPSGNDIRHRLTVSGVYELPVGPGKRFLPAHWLGQVVGGWSIGLLGTLQSGAPFSVLTQTNTTNAFSAGGLRADVAGNPALPSSERTLDRWFNTDAFTQPAPFTFGNSRRGLLRGDGIVNADLSLAKNVALGRARSLQVRVELFNAFNVANFDLPGHTLGAPDFGIVSNAAGGRTIQLGLRAVF